MSFRIEHIAPRSVTKWVKKLAFWSWFPAINTNYSTRNSSNSSCSAKGFMSTDTQMRIEAESIKELTVGADNRENGKRDRANKAVPWLMRGITRESKSFSSLNNLSGKSIECADHGRWEALDLYRTAPRICWGWFSLKLKTREELSIKFQRIQLQEPTRLSSPTPLPAFWDWCDEDQR